MHSETVKIYVSFLSSFAYRRYSAKNQIRPGILFKVIFYMKDTCLANRTMQNLV
jgi:hypothetical protein